MSTTVSAPADKVVSAPSSNVQYAGFAAGIASVSGVREPDQFRKMLIISHTLFATTFTGLDEGQSITL
jgi:hypothetical protein